LRELEQAFVKIRDIVPGENVDSQLAACYPDSRQVLAIRRGVVGRWPVTCSILS